MATARDKVKALLGNQHWRLNNLYKIVDKTGHVVTFKMNEAQQALYDSMWYLNVVLKARQLGYSTFIQIYMLDQCLFNSNVSAGVIAHSLVDAVSLFNTKLKFPYDNLPQQIRDARPLIRDSARELAFANGSSIRVGTSLRSGTLQFLHISELGKIAAKYPEKAREIRTGALNTVEAGSVVFIESTAEGQEGDFYDICQAAQALQRNKAKLTKLDFKFHFSPWWSNPEYALDDDVVITDDNKRYFAELELRNGIKLTREQKAWYIKKATTQLGDMKREFPSTPEESFAASVEGAYYGAWIEAAETAGRIGVFHADPTQPVHTVWDLGVGDSTAIWFFQILHKEIRLVGYYENHGEGAPFYAGIVNKMFKDNGWQRAGSTDYVPHDARVREWGTKHTRLEQMIANGLSPKIPTEMSIDDGINAVRAILPICTFDIEGCAQGIKSLKAYRKEWNKDAGCWASHPILKHWSKHGADAFRYMAAAYRDITPEKPEPEKPELSAAAFRDEALRGRASRQRKYR